MADIAQNIRLIISAAVTGGNEVQQLVGRLGRVNQTLAGLPSPSREAATVTDRLTAAQRGAGDEAEDLGRQLNRARGNVSQFGGSIKEGIVGLLGAAGIASALHTAMDAAGEFEKAVAQIMTVSDTTKIPMKQLEDTVLSLSREFGKMPVEVAKATYDAYSAGAVDAAQNTEFMTVALKAAVAGGVEVADSVRGLSAVINGWGLSFGDASRVADTMFTVIANGQTTMAQLSGNLGKVAGQANTLGLGFEEIGGVLAVLTKKIGSTEISTTALSAAMAGVARVTGEQVPEFKKLGFENGQAAFKALGLAKTFDIVSRAAGGNITKLEKLAGGSIGLQAVMSSTGAAMGEITANILANEKATGRLGQEFNKVQGVVGEGETALVAVQIAMIKFGKAMAPIQSAVRKIVIGIAGWISANHDAVAATTQLVGAIYALRAVLAVMGGWFTAVATAVVFLATKFKPFRDFLQQIADSIAPLFRLAMGLIEVTLADVSRAIDSFIYGFQRTIDGIILLAQLAREKIKETLGLENEYAKVQEDLARKRIEWAQRTKEVETESAQHKKELLERSAEFQDHVNEIQDAWTEQNGEAIKKNAEEIAKTASAVVESGEKTQEVAAAVGAAIQAVPGKTVGISARDDTGIGVTAAKEAISSVKDATPKITLTHNQAVQLVNNIGMRLAELDGDKAHLEAQLDSDHEPKIAAINKAIAALREKQRKARILVQVASNHAEKARAVRETLAALRERFRRLMLNVDLADDKIAPKVVAIRDKMAELRKQIRDRPLHVRVDSNYLARKRQLIQAHGELRRKYSKLVLQALLESNYSPQAQKILRSIAQIRKHENIKLKATLTPQVDSGARNVERRVERIPREVAISALLLGSKRVIQAIDNIRRAVVRVPGSIITTAKLEGARHINQTAQNITRYIRGIQGRTVHITVLGSRQAWAMARDVSRALSSMRDRTVTIWTRRRSRNRDGGPIEMYSDGGSYPRRSGRLPGYSRKDTVPAMLTAGEYIINAASVRDVERAVPGILDLLNGIRGKGSVVKKLSSLLSSGGRKMAAGGKVIRTALKKRKPKKFVNGGAVVLNKTNGGAVDIRTSIGMDVDAGLDDLTEDIRAFTRKLAAEMPILFDVQVDFKAAYEEARQEYKKAEQVYIEAEKISPEAEKTAFEELSLRERALKIATAQNRDIGKQIEEQRKAASGLIRDFQLMARKISDNMPILLDVQADFQPVLELGEREVKAARVKYDAAVDTDAGIAVISRLETELNLREEAYTAALAQDEAISQQIDKQHDQVGAWLEDVRNLVQTVEENMPVLGDMQANFKAVLDQAERELEGAKTEYFISIEGGFDVATRVGLAEELELRQANYNEALAQYQGIEKQVSAQEALGRLIAVDTALQAENRTATYQSVVGIAANMQRIVQQSSKLAIETLDSVAYSAHQVTGKDISIDVLGEKDAKRAAEEIQKTINDTHGATIDIDVAGEDAARTTTDAIQADVYGVEGSNIGIVTEGAELAQKTASFVSKTISAVKDKAVTISSRFDTRGLIEWAQAQRTAAAILYAPRAPRYAEGGQVVSSLSPAVMAVTRVISQIKGQAVDMLTTGGKIPGYSRQDTIPAMLTAGEYVVNALSVRNIEAVVPGILSAINNIRSQGDVMSTIRAIITVGGRGMAAGGVIPGTASVRLANGGMPPSALGSAGNTLNFSTTFNVSAVDAAGFRRVFDGEVLPRLKTAIKQDLQGIGYAIRSVS